MPMFMKTLETYHCYIILSSVHDSGKEESFEKKATQNSWQNSLYGQNHERGSELQTRDPRIVQSFWKDLHT